LDVKDKKVESVIEWNSQNDDPNNLATQLRMDPVEGQVPVELAATVIAHIARTTENGAILLFLPGLKDIGLAAKVLQNQRILNVDFNDKDKFKIFMLHSSTSEGHGDVFKPVPRGCRKIILATNVAETSITIPDIQYVVDTGKHKENNFHQMLGIWSLPCKWISKSSVKQRSGRAGRVQNGSYYALFS
jgi:HrpA-like RNA helicase